MEISLPVFDWTTIGSMMIVAVMGLTVMMTALFTRSVKFCMIIALAGLAGSVIYSISLWGADKTGFAGMVILDNFTIITSIIVLTGAILTILLSYNLLKENYVIKGEYLALIMFAVFGMLAMVSAGDLMMIFLGLETLSISLYILAGSRRTDEYCLEAAFKYFLIGAFASGFLLFGMAYLYGATGTTNLVQMVTLFQSAASLNQNYMVIGIGFILIGLGFKISLVPFHMWTPDVYEGAPTPISAFMSTGVKAAGFAVLLRIFLYTAHSFFIDWQMVIWGLAVLTMTIGNVVALSQNSIKRMLAYSSIAHAGYMLVAFTSGSNDAVSSILYYLISYTFMNIGAFGVIAYLENKKKTVYTLNDISGMGFKRPLLAAGMAIFMFSLAGIPPSAGFFAKFYAFRAAVGAGLIWLPVIGVMNSVVSVYYYIRVVLNMYMKEPETDFSEYEFDPSSSAALTISAIAILILGLFPSLITGIASIKLF